MNLEEGIQLKRLALVAFFGVLLGVLPLTPLGQAGASSNATVRIIHGVPTGPAVDVWIDGAAAKVGLTQAVGFDASLAPGTHAVVVCVSPSTLTPAGACTAGPILSDTISVTSGTTYAMVIGGTGPFSLAQFADDGSQTANGKARFQFNHGASAIPVPVSICLDGAAQTDLTASYRGSGIAEVTPGSYTLGLSVGGGACNGATPVNLVAGTSFVLTATNSLGAPTAPQCGQNCVQVLVVGQGRPTNTPADPPFCAALLDTQAAGNDLTTVLGDITVGTPSTYPTAAAVNTAVDAALATIAAGDKSVPTAIKPQWEIVTAGLRTVTAGLQIVGGDVSLLPPAQLTAIVDGLNAEPSAETTAATAVLTEWYVASCSAATPAAVPTSASPTFTG